MCIRDRPKSSGFKPLFNKPEAKEEIKRETKEETPIKESSTNFEASTELDSSNKEKSIDSYTAAKSQSNNTKAAELNILTSGDDISNLDFEAVELFTLSGSIQNKGKGLAGIKVDLGQAGEAKTDNDGNFLIEDVEEDASYEVTVNSEDYLSLIHISEPTRPY